MGLGAQSGGRLGDSHMLSEDGLNSPPGRRGQEREAEDEASLARAPSQMLAC